MMELDRRRLYLFIYLFFIPFSSAIHAICLEEPATFALYRSPRISSDVMFSSAVFGLVLQQSPIQYAMVTHITAGTCMYYMYVCCMCSGCVFSVAAVLSACLRVMSRVTRLHDSLLSSIILAA